MGDTETEAERLAFKRSQIISRAHVDAGTLILPHARLALTVAEPEVFGQC